MATGSPSYITWERPATTATLSGSAFHWIVSPSLTSAMGNLNPGRLSGRLPSPGASRSSPDSPGVTSTGFSDFSCRRTCTWTGGTSTRVCGHLISQALADAAPPDAPTVHDFALMFVWFRVDADQFPALPRRQGQSVAGRAFSAALPRQPRRLEGPGNPGFLGLSVPGGNPHLWLGKGGSP